MVDTDKLLQHPEDFLTSVSPGHSSMSLRRRNFNSKKMLSILFVEMFCKEFYSTVPCSLEVMMHNLRSSCTCCGEAVMVLKSINCPRTPIC